MLDAEFGAASICLMVGASGYTSELAFDPQTPPTVVHAEQPDGSVISVLLTPKQGPPCMPFMLMVENLVHLYNRTGKKLSLCQPEGATVGTESERAVDLPMDGTPIAWTWERPVSQTSIAEAAMKV